MADKNITIYHVSERADVSLTTVSRVLNHPEKVKPETREKVLRIIEELGYRPNAMAKSLAQNKTTSIGVIVSDFSKQSTANLFNGILDIGNQFDYSIKIYSIRDMKALTETVSKIVADRVDGVIYVNEELEQDCVGEIKDILLKNKIPTVFANVSPQTKDISAVHIDYVEAMRELVEKFIQNGHKDIYFIEPIKEYALDKYKLRGYLQAMEEANLKPLIYKSSENPTKNFQEMKDFFKTKKISAAIASTDILAISVLNAVKSLGMKIPNDIEIASSQNTILVQLGKPMITSIDFPVYDIGAVSMRLLTKLMDEGQEPTNMVLKSTIIKRGSTTF